MRSSFYKTLSIFFFCICFNSVFSFASQAQEEVLSELSLPANLESFPAQKPEQAKSSKAKHKIHDELSSIPLIRKNTQVPIILVGYEKGISIVTDINSYGNKGYGYDLLTKFSHFADIEFQFVEIEGSLFDAVNNGLVDIGGLYAKTPEREAMLSFGNTPVDFSQYSLVTKGRQDFYYADPKAIDGKVVATYPGCPGITVFDAFLKENNISVKYIFDDVRNFIDLEADFYIYASDIMKSTDLHTVLNLRFEDLFFFSAKNNKALMDFFDKHFKQFFTENMSFTEKLKEKYRLLDNEFKNRTLTRDEAEMIKGKTFRVGYIENHAPFQSKDVYGNPQGISVEVLELLMEQFDFTVEYFPYTTDTALPFSENFDLLISVIGERNHIAKFYDATDAYESVELMITFAKSEKPPPLRKLSAGQALKNRKIGVLNYITFPQQAFFRRFPNAQIFHYPNADKLFEALQTGEISAMITTQAGSDSVAHSQGGHRAVLHLPLELKFHVSKNLGPRYLEIFNLMVGKLSAQDVYAIVVDETAKFLPIFGSRQFFRENVYYFLAAGLSIVCIVAGLIILVRQRSTINVLAKDDVTPLISLSKFYKDADKILQKSTANTYELIMLDIDYFRLINNYYGMEKGTEVIKTMAQALLDCYNEKDTIIVRRVAEQFLVFKKVGQGKSAKEAIGAYVVPKIKTVIGDVYPLKMSIGSSKNLAGEKKISSLIDNATVAMRKAKKVHKTSFYEFDEEMLKKTNTQMDIIYRMEHALKNREFIVHYQPKIALQSLNIVGAKALVRWIPPIGESFYPETFIPIMEENGFISQLEIYVFEEICRLIQKNINKKAYKIMMNVSPITLSQTKILNQVIEIIKKYNIQPSQIEIEITESAVGDFEESLPLIIKILHKVGFTVTMNYFSASNSSLNRLKTLEVDVVKFDEIFINSHCNTPHGRLVLEQTISLAKQLGLKTLATGIEHKEQAKDLREMFCDIAQGDYFSKVLQEADFVHLLTKDKNHSLN